MTNYYGLDTSIPTATTLEDYDVEDEVKMTIYYLRESKPEGAPMNFTLTRDDYGPFTDGKSNK